ncbi:S1C family serine protease [Acetobacter conturbans]|uniref:PDZ domain-containing protein n=1 Tax=Acetobacter conturbans TaxID=1737472 RepID=A0ABX0K1Y8_9PROT|nr:trypsin-like peptidase domain-containing protein [Acetobacter conturbans]NHN88308.1 PDZ domain-containing protein [Acetobacter conturbans]
MKTGMARFRFLTQRPSRRRERSSIVAFPALLVGLSVGVCAPLQGARSEGAPASAVVPVAPAVTDEGAAVLGVARPLTFAPLVKMVGPAVVNIAVTRDINPSSSRHLHVLPDVKGTPLERRFRERLRRHGEEMLGAGSGFIIDPSGIIVTNNHVVGDASNITVSLANGHELPARVLGSDDLTDIAVIKVESLTPLPYVKWGDSRQVQVGDWIMAAGNPFGLGSSITAGIVSARGRDIGASPFDDFLQLDAPINPGNSGGPTFNMRGEVIAINTAIVSPTGGSVGIGFSIPSELVIPVVEVLRTSGHIDRGWLGVTLEDEEGQDGARVVDVDRDGPAQKGGLRKGDFVTTVGTERVANARTLIRIVAATRPGTLLPVVVRRKTVTLQLQVPIGTRPVDDGRDGDGDDQ